MATRLLLHPSGAVRHEVGREGGREGGRVSARPSLLDKTHMATRLLLHPSGAVRHEGGREEGGKRGAVSLLKRGREGGREGGGKDKANSPSTILHTHAQAVLLLSTVARHVGWPDTEVFLMPLLSPYLK